MTRPLVNSALFSLGVHAILLLRLGLPGGSSRPVEVDVRRGTSSVELELILQEGRTGREETQAIPPSAEAEEERGAIPATPSVQPFLDEGVQVQWKLGARENPPPRYPWAARIYGWEGTVMVRAMVTPAGEASSVQVKKSSGHAILDQAASAAIGRWRFLPARRMGRAVASSVEVPITFKLEQQQEE